MKQSEPDNPYAASAIDPAPPHPASARWHVADGTLMVSDGAELPEVDVRGSSGETLVRVKRTVRVYTFWIRAFGIIPGIAMLAARQVAKPLGYTPEKFQLVAMALLFVLSIGMHLATTAKFEVAYSISARYLKRRQLVRWISGPVMFGAFAWGLWHIGAHLSGWFLGSTFVFFAAMMIFALASVPPVQCLKASDGWFRLTAIKESAIRELTLVSLQNDRAG